MRRYGTEGAARVVASLRCVWISHIHADHHAGLPRLLAVRQRLLGPDAPPLPVRLPTPATRWSRLPMELCLAQLCDTDLGCSESIQV